MVLKYEQSGFKFAENVFLNTASTRSALLMLLIIQLNCRGVQKDVPMYKLVRWSYKKLVKLVTEKRSALCKSFLFVPCPLYMEKFDHFDFRFIPNVNMAKLSLND